VSKDITLYDKSIDPTNYTIVGDKGMGKTTLIKNLLKILIRNNEAVIAYDRLFQFEDILPCYDFVNVVPDGVNRQFCIRQDTVENFMAIAEEYRKQVLKENPKDRLYVIIDEIDTVYGTHGPITNDPLTKKLLVDMVDYSRHKRIETWGCVRRPQRVWMNYYEQSERIFLFHVSGGLAREKLLQTIGSKEMMRAVSRLKPHKFLVYPDEIDIYDSFGTKTLDLGTQENEE